MFWLSKAIAVATYFLFFIFSHSSSHHKPGVDFLGRKYVFFPMQIIFQIVTLWLVCRVGGPDIHSRVVSAAQKKERKPSTSTRIKACCRPAAQHENTTSWSSVGGPAVIVSCQTSKVLPHSFAPDILLPFIYFSHSLVFWRRRHSWPNLASFLPPCAPSRNDGRGWWGSCTFYSAKKQKKTQKTTPKKKKNNPKGNKVKFNVQMGCSEFSFSWWCRHTTKPVYVITSERIEELSQKVTNGWFSLQTRHMASSGTFEGAVSDTAALRSWGHEFIAPPVFCAKQL